MPRVPLPLVSALVLLPAVSWAGACVQAARVAEARHGLPPGLLAAVGRVESGIGGNEAWPWSVDVAGQGFRLADGADAAAMVRALRVVGVRSVDVGCFQVNLYWHPASFASVPDAFDPARNAEVAAGLLAGLHASGGSWQDAVRRYHSSTPALGNPYLQRVLAAWSGVAARVIGLPGAVQVFVPGAASPAGRSRLPTVYVPSPL